MADLLEKTSNFCGCLREKHAFSGHQKKSMLFADADCPECCGSGLSPSVLKLLFVGADATKQVALQHHRIEKLETTLRLLRSAVISNSRSEDAPSLRRTMLLSTQSISRVLQEEA